MAQPGSGSSLKRKYDDEQSGPAAKEIEEVSRSAAIYDRESKFYALYSPTIKPKDLQALEEITSASHKVVGWRRKSNQQSINKAEIYVTGSDDDGEKYAGKKIEKMLEAAGVSGVCVVARWYGGIMLGPVRFQHIEACAKEAIARYREQEEERQSKKRKLEEDELEHSKLSKSLAERDQSIVVLRTLADQKEKKLAKNSGLENDTTSLAHAEEKAVVSTKPEIDYAAMPLQRLRGLAKARDATLSFLLKRIDEAERAAGGTDVKKPP
jgi:putative IMPACT (imprinted ancient) family translation regulator